ncbi:MAG: NAD(P)-dependent oxidoreductase [Wenzhouxiangellaceae bacterium]
MSTLRAGFIGLGAMGAPMAEHLAQHGWLQAVWNRTADTAIAVADRCGCHAAAELSVIAQSCDVILLCVSADNDVTAVIDALEPGLRPGQIVVDHSTVAPATSQRIAARLAEKSVQFLDAPVSGGVEGARNGQLSVMIGGDSDILERIRPLLQSYSARIMHMGPVGNGQATKAVNQVLVAGIAQGVCEGLALADALRLPREALLQVLTGGAAGCWFLEKRGQTMLDDEFSQGFKLALLLKDLGIVQQIAQQHQATLPLVERSVEDYRELVRRGDGDNDISGLIRLKRELIGD